MSYPPNMPQPPPPYGYPPPYPYYGPPPPQTSGKIVIIVVLVVVIAFIVIPAAVSFYMIYSINNMMRDINFDNPTASSITTKFTNPSEGAGTYNHGGWQIRIASIAGSKPQLSTVTVTLQKDGLLYTQMQHVASGDVSLSYTTGTSNQWYLHRYATHTPKFVDNGKAKNLTASTAKDLGIGEFETVQDAYMIYIDSDADGAFSAGDVIYIYSDVNGDGSPEVTSSNNFQILGGNQVLTSGALT